MLPEQAERSASFVTTLAYYLSIINYEVLTKPTSKILVINRSKSTLWVLVNISTGLVFGMSLSVLGHRIIFNKASILDKTTVLAVLSSGLYAFGAQIFCCLLHEQLILHHNAIYALDSRIGTKLTNILYIWRNRFLTFQYF